jgi:ribonuclease VapC
MIVDSSCIVAILRNEPDARTFVEAMAAAMERKISAANWLEASIVIDRVGNPILSRRMDSFIADSGTSVEPVTLEQVSIARAAYRDFGKGSGHPAGLNFGDCFAYALAKATGETLLFKGDDFAETDIASALSK